MNIETEIKNKVAEARKIAIKNPDIAFEMSKEAYDAAKVNELKLEEAYALFTMSLACRSMTKLSDCYDYAFDALKIFENIKDPIGTAGALNLIGIVYYYYAMYEPALEYFIKASYLLKETEDFITQSRLLNNMGEVYREVGNLDEALVHYNKALDLCEKYHYTTNMAVILENIGEVYFRKADYAFSYECYKKSYDILAKDDDITALSEVQCRIGKIYFTQNKYDKARDCYNHALTQLEKIGNKYFSIDVLINIAELEMQENEVLFLPYLIKAIEYGEEINARKKLSQIYKIITEFYEKIGEYELALEFYKRYHVMEQEIETTVISHKLEIIKMEISKLLSEDELEKLTKLNKQLEQDIANQNKLLKAIEKTNRNLQFKAFSDELIDIPNRRGIKSHLSSVWKESQVKAFYAALFVIDIDYFKRYNDHYGHLEGDTCIKKIANTLKSVLKNRNGIIGRIGGEEFICFIKDIEYMDVAQLAEMLRKSVENLDIKYLWNNSEFPVTISIGGVYGYSSNFESPKEMYSIADEELYKAKQKGRNKIAIRIKRNPIRLASE